MTEDRGPVTLPRAPGGTAHLLHAAQCSALLQYLPAVEHGTLHASLMSCPVAAHDQAEHVLLPHYHGSMGLIMRHYTLDDAARLLPIVLAQCPLAALAVLSLSWHPDTLPFYICRSCVLRRRHADFHCRSSSPCYPSLAPRHTRIAPGFSHPLVRPHRPAARSKSCSIQPCSRAFGRWLPPMLAELLSGASLAFSPGAPVMCASSAGRLERQRRSTPLWRLGKCL